MAVAPHLSTLAGHIVESVIGSCLSTLTGLDVAHLPERPGQPEVDFVVSVGTKRLPIEVTYQARVDPVRDVAGLQAFLDTPVNEAEVGLLVHRPGAAPQVNDPRIVPVSLADLLLIR